MSSIDKPLSPLALRAGLMSRGTMRDMLSRVDAAIGGEHKMIEEVNKSSQAYWEFQKLRARVEPKELSVTHENSAESLIAALEAKRRGEVIEYTDVESVAITDAAPLRKYLWPAALVFARV